AGGPARTLAGARLGGQPRSRGGPPGGAAGPGGGCARGRFLNLNQQRTRAALLSASSQLMRSYFAEGLGLLIRGGGGAYGRRRSRTEAVRNPTSPSTMRSRIVLPRTSRPSSGDEAALGRCTVRTLPARRLKVSAPRARP